MRSLFSYLSVFHNKTSNVIHGYIVRRTRTHKIIEICVGIALITALSFSFLSHVYSATFTFVQTSWVGGATANNPAHPTNETGWTQYSTKDSGIVLINGGTDLQLATTSASSTQTSDTDFNLGTYSSTGVVGTSTAAYIVLAGAPTFTGGTITRVGSEYVHTFLSSGTFYAPNNATATVLIVGGGGGGGDIGGGGGGGVRSSSTFNITAGSIAVTVGAGGTTATAGSPNATNGASSSIGSFVSSGGGAGGNGAGTVAKAGGSGGGSGGDNSGGIVTGGSGNTPSTNPVQGYAGGSGIGQSNGQKYIGGGGGGAGGVGGDYNGGSPSAGNGGSGVASSISGSSVTYGGGGGGGSFLYNQSSNITPGTGGSGGGGRGGRDSQTSLGGTVNTGGGAGGLGLYGSGSPNYTATTGGSGIVIIRQLAPYPSSGTFTSSVINTGQSSTFSTLSFTKLTPTNTTLTIDVRAGNTSSPDGTWTSWQTGISNGGSLSAISGNQYVQYRANLETSDISTSSSLSDITFNYYTYTSSSTLTSSAYNSGSTGNVLSKVAWSQTTPTGTTVKFQMRTAPDSAGSPGTWTSWMGPDGTSGTYFTDNTGGETMPSALRDGTNDQWFQYKVILATTDPSATPTLSDVTVTYVVNAPPDFDSSYGTNGTYIHQVSTSTDSNFNLVEMLYKVRDSDTSSGTTNPGYITPSFEYNIGGGWVSISSQYLNASDTSNKAVSEVGYTLYQAFWNAKSQIPSTYTASAQVRVKANDNEGANNIGYGTSTTFTLDTTDPAVTAHIDGVAGTVSISATDNSQILNYAISNSSDLSSATTGSGTSTSLALLTSWSLSNSSTSATVYSTVRDIYGNVATTTTVAPVIPSNIEIRDVSNAQTGAYQEFVLWPQYPTIASGATFQKYEVYRSTDGSSYSLLTTITNSSTNYYVDTSVASSSTYYYKVKFVDQDNDTSNYSNVVSDVPNGQGGSDATSPTITSVTVSDIKNTSAKITWTTDELSNSRVDFGTSISYGSQATDATYTTSHSVYMTGLTSNTTYYARAKSTDPSGNLGTNDNSGAGYSFTTVGGPVITNVTVSDVSDSGATIFWNTSVSSDSYVDYSIASDLSNYAEAGSADLVTGATSTYQHKVTLTGLTNATTYYFQVSSRESGGSQTVDTNSGAYYTLRTTYDTKAPTISDIQNPVRASEAAVITWKTDELSDSQVEYGTTASTTTGSYANTTSLVTTPSIFHSVTLSAETYKATGGTNLLVKNTRYYYRVKSKDSANNTTVSDEGTFMTTEDGAVVYASSGGGGSVSLSDVIDTTAPVISNVNVEKITPFGATVTFDTSEDARGLIQYGEGKELNVNAGDVSFSRKHSIDIRGLKMGTTYNYLVDAIDKSGNVGFGVEATFKTDFLAENLGALEKLGSTFDTVQQKIEDLIASALPSINPPFIDKPVVNALGEDFVSISFNTNVKAYGLISYATDDEYKQDGKYTQEVSKLDQKSMEHSFDINNLKANTKYHYSAKSYVFPGAPSQTEDSTFITSASKIEAKITDRKIDSFHVIWSTNVPATSVVEYKKKGSVKAEKRTDDAMTTYHDVLVDHLLPATTYEVRPYSITVDGNVINPKSGLVVTTIKDVTPPAISSFKVDSALVTGRNDRTQTIVSWKTDEPASSIVYYEEGSGSPNQALANKQEDLNSFTQNHVVILTTLKPGSIYRFQIASVDEAGNITKLPVRTIVTPKANESVVDVIFKNFDDTFNFIKKTQ